ncbi:MAG: hypothetical protein JWQ88_3725 [Rhodoferax sp.]|nr:hypothetical protein [Rhodoferax sp.]
MSPVGRQQKITAATTVVLAFFILNLVFYYVQGAFEGRAFPLTIFLPPPAQRFADFYAVWGEWRRLHFAGVGVGLAYFPATFLFVEPLTWLASPQRALALFETAFLACFFAYSLRKLKTGERRQDWGNAVVLTFMSYPVLLTLHAGNLEPVVFALLLLHVEAFRGGRFTWSAVFLGLAAAMKLYPLVFLLLFAMQRRYREGFVVLATAAVATLVPLLIFPGGVLDAGLGAYLQNLHRSQQLYQDVVVNVPLGMHFGHSLLNGLRAVFADALPAMNLLRKPYQVVAVVALLLLALRLVATRPPLWKTVTVLVIAMCLLPFASADYKLLHLFIPFYLYLNEPRAEGSPRRDWAFLWLFALLLVPKTFGSLHGMPLLTLNMVLNPLLMLLLAALVLGLPSPRLSPRLAAAVAAARAASSALALRGKRTATAVVGVVLVLGLCLLLDGLRDGPLTSSVWRVAAMNTGAPGPEGRPVVAGELPSWKDVSSLDMEFEARANTDAYPNFFQTSDTIRSLRMELVQPRKLYLALGDSHYLLVAENFSFDQWHRYRVRMVKEKSVEVWIDGALVRTWTGAPAAPDLALDNLVVGTGFAGQRGFAGNIRDFRVTLEHVKRPNWVHWVVDTMAMLAVAGLLAFSLRVLRRSGAATTEASPTTGSSILAWAGGALACGAAGWFVYVRGWPPGKWALLLCFAPLFALPLLPWRVRWIGGLLKVAFAAGVMALAFTQHARAPASFWWTAAAAVAAGVSAHALTARHTSLRPQAVGVALMFAACWISVSSAPAFQTLTLALRRYPATAAALLAGLVVPFAMAWLLPRPGLARSWSARGRWGWGWPYLLFAALALRNDMLKVAGAEMHWEYFAGPIRAVRDGGWLLWDVPSQYGFLNVLLASLLPTASEWQALYLFQAAVLFSSAALCFSILRIALPGQHTAAALLTAAAFFFADPALIGPAPYPSSSGMRFLWVYVLLYFVADCFLRRGDDAATFIRRAALPWVLAVLWSGESAVYSTTIYVTAPLALLWARVVRTGPQAGLGDVLRATRRSLLLLALCGAGIAVYYLVRIRHLPDLRMHFLYSTAYAKGFGELPVPWHGPMWIAGLAVALGAAIAASSWRRKDVPTTLAALCLMAATVALFTYYAGRAVPNNLTALTPLVLVLLLLLYRLAVATGESPWPAAALAAGFVLQTASGFVAAQFAPGVELPRWQWAGVDQQLRATEPELQKLLSQAGITATSPLVYYGFAVAMPRGPDGAYPRSWLPVPVQLLEDPIAPKVQERILARFTKRRPQGGFIVQKKGEFDDRLQHWRELLARTHREAAVVESARYRVIRFEPLVPATGAVP